MNIWSGARGDELAAALTNPTTWSRRKGGISTDYPVTVDGVTYPDAEAAYKAAQRRPGDVEAMIPIIALKFAQHPTLVGWVEARGGREWLLTCSHFVGARSARAAYWEGVGVESPFIRALVAGWDAFQAVQRRALAES